MKSRLGNVLHFYKTKVLSDLNYYVLTFKLIIKYERTKERKKEKNIIKNMNDCNILNKEWK